MFRTRFVCLLAALWCFFGIPGLATAAEVDCNSSYCFSTEDFSADPSIQGICITGLSDDSGTLLLDSRILVAGDILTAEQVPG